MTTSLTKSYRDFVFNVVTTLETLGLDYAVGGNFASAYYGVPRATLDLDVTLALASAPMIRPLTLALAEAGCYAFTDDVLDTICEDRPLAAFSPESGFRVDLWRAADTLARQALARRRRVMWDPVRRSETWLLSPEDTIIYYLRRFQNGLPSLALHDLVYMLIAGGEALDRGHIRHWALRLGVLAYWEALETATSSKRMAAEGEQRLAAVRSSRQTRSAPA